MTPSSSAGQPEPARHAGESTPPEALNPPRAGAATTPRPRRRWRPGLVLALVVAAAAAGTTWSRLPVPRPAARTALRVPQSSYLPGEPARNPEGYQRTQAAMVKSRLVLNAALRDPQVAKLPVVAAQGEPVEWLEKEVQADFSLAPEVLRISLQGHNPDELVVLVNAIRKAYIKEVVDKEKGARQARLAWLKEQRERFEAQLRESQKLQRDIEKTAGGRDAGLRARVLSFLQQSLGMTEQELLKTRSDLRKAEVELRALQAREKEVTVLRARIAYLKDLEGQLTAEVEKQRKDLAQKTEHGIRVDEFKENLSQVEAWARRLGDEELKLKLDLQAPSNVAILEEGTVVRADLAGAQLVRTGLSALAGLAGFVLFGFSWVVLRFLVSVL